MEGHIEASRSALAKVNEVTDEGTTPLFIA